MYAACSDSRLSPWAQQRLEDCDSDGLYSIGDFFLRSNLGVSQTSASNAAFLISLTVILTAFAELVVNKKRISNRLLGLTVCSVIGVLLLTSEQGIEFSLNTGDYFILTAALLRALMVTLTKRFTAGKEITTSTLTSLQVVGGGILRHRWGFGLSTRFCVCSTDIDWSFG